MAESALSYSDEQRFLSESARRFVSERCGIDRLRVLRQPDHPVGFDWSRWREMAQLGFFGMALPEELGGQGLSFVDQAIVLREAGRRLVPEPLLSAVVGSSVLLRSESRALRERYLRDVACGEVIVTVAHQEAESRGPTAPLTTRLRRTPSGLFLDGTKVQVSDGHVARAFLVSCATDTGAELILVDRETRGVSVERQFLIDGRGAARVTVEEVRVEDDDRVSSAGGGETWREDLIDIAAVATSVEMLGAAEQAFEDTIAYLKTRKQFGVPIGSFQALQHRAARMYIELQLAQSIVMAAVRAVGESSKDRSPLASMAKARMSDVFMHVAKEAIQMHGGIGVTDEHSIGLYLKRARVAEVSWGDASWHRQRLARLSGF